MDDKIEIRQATLADLDELLRIFPQLATRATSAGAQIPERAKAAQILQQLLADTKIQLLVAVSQAAPRVLGVITLVVVPNLTYSGQPWAMLENVVVDRVARRRSIGRHLVEAAIQRASEQGCYKVQLISGTKPEQLVDPGVNKVPCFYHDVHE